MGILLSSRFSQNYDPNFDRTSNANAAPDGSQIPVQLDFCEHYQQKEIQGKLIPLYKNL